MISTLGHKPSQFLDRSKLDPHLIWNLSQLDPDSRHRAIRATRFESVGDWILETSVFREWMGGEGGADKAVLFCSGNPGVGKTYLSSLVVDSLRDRAVAWLYCDHASSDRHTVTAIIGAILRKLLTREALRDIQEADREGRELLLQDMMRILRTAIASLRQAFICIDALDECPPENLPELLESLRDIVQEFPRTRIFLTGRHHVQEVIRRHFAGMVAIPICPDPKDIRDYLRTRLEGDSKPEEMDNDLRADIGKIIVEKVSDSVDAILGQATIHSRRIKLEELRGGNGLSAGYTETLTRLDAQKGNELVLGLNALMWVLYSERPLREEELCNALGVETGYTDLVSENVPTIQTILASCLGLLTVEASSSTVRLVHFTLKQHLLSDPTLSYSPHWTIAEVCLTYLNFGSVRDLPPTLDSAPSTMPLLEYASVYWGEHAKRGMTENGKILALRLLDRFDKHISAQLLLLCNRRYTGWSSLLSQVAGGPIGFTGLHGVAFLGIVEMIYPVLDMRKWDANAADCTGNTPLIWAARRGQEEIVEFLLERKEINPDLADSEYGRTPLSWAAESGHGGIAMMLLARRDVNPNQIDTKYRRTPLSWAAESGHGGIVMMLLARKDTDPNNADSEYGRTPLIWAAKNGHEGVVIMLLEQVNVDPNQIDTEYGRASLSWAAVGGHEGVVKMLLERVDIDPNQIDTEYGRTPLSWAAMGGHEGVVKMLLAREDTDPNNADSEYGRTPLIWAAKNGHEGVVKMLLEREKVNPNQIDTEYGRAPLSWAAEYGRDRIVMMLLERVDVIPDYADTEYCRTPLMWAIIAGREGVVRILLEREGVNPDYAHPRCGVTPLLLAAVSGYGGIVKMLLEREDVNPDRADIEYGQTPLSRAAAWGHEGVVKMLLEREDVNPGRADTKDGRTPLAWAFRNGHGGVVKMLLQRNDVGCDGVARILP